MEYGLRLVERRPWRARLLVLILVVMEYGLRQCKKRGHLESKSLNPCCNGIWSQTKVASIFSTFGLRLNPCCNGIWSLTYGSVLRTSLYESSLNPCCNGIWSLTTAANVVRTLRADVLILVVMEYGLWPGRKTHNSSANTVLILVVMEYGLWQERLLCRRLRRSRVLILVVMEYGLWLMQFMCMTIVMSLNPCCNGIWSLTYDKTCRY